MSWNSIISIYNNEILHYSMCIILSNGKSVSISSGHSGLGPPSCPAAGAQPEDLGSLPSLRDMVAAFLFARTTGSKAVQVSQRQTDAQTRVDTHTGH